MHLIKQAKNKSRVKWIILTVLLLSAFIILPHFAFAQDSNLTQFTNAAGVSTTSSLPTIIGRIVQVILGLLGIVAILLILFAGFKWMTAGGDSTKVEKAKKLIIQAVVGLIIIFAAFAIVTFIFDRVINPVFRPGDGGSCTPGEVKTMTSSGIVDCAYNTCGSDGRWGSWNYEGCYFFTKNQFSYVSGFKDVSIVTGASSTPWQDSVGQSFGGVKSVPQSASMQVRGYGHYKGGSNTISGMALNWAGLATGSSSFSPIDNIIKTIGGKEYNVVENSFASWDTSGYALGATSTLQIILSPPDSDYFYKILRVKVISKHCFDGIQNQGETGLDCGGECGGCPGDSCNVNASEAVCQADDSMCRFGICELNSCTCAKLPTIDYISPAYDKSGDTKLYNSNTWTDDVPNGARGNYITIWGKNFGNTTGTITFVDKNDSSKIFTAQLPSQPCSATWGDQQIVVEIPNTDRLESGVTNSVSLANNASTNYYVVVENSSGLKSVGKPFQVNAVDRPGICSATPGKYPAPTTISGAKFPFGASDTKNVVWTVGSYVGGSWVNGRLTNAKWSDINVTSTQANSWTQSSVIDNIPESNSTNTANIRIFNGAEYSNYYFFQLSRGGVGESCGVNSGVCAVNNGLCQTGLTCNYDNCLCEQRAVKVCNAGTVSSTCSVASPIPNCSYVNVCKSDGTGWQCSPKSDDPDCKSSVFGSAGQSLYTWAFNATFPKGIGFKCGIDAWGACDPKGCGAGLRCDVASTTNPCTCVAASACNKEGATQECASQGSCKMQKLCTGGSWSECQLVDPFCYNPVPQAQQSVFSWLFNFGGGAINGNPYIIEDCNSNRDCSVRRQPPSPSPWFMDHGNGITEGWGPKDYITASSAPACVNAIIQARFSQKMFDATVNNTNIKVYKLNASGTPLTEVSGIQVSLTQDGTLMTITRDADVNFSPSSKYQVAFFKDVVSDANEALVFNPNYADINAEKAKRNCIANSVYCWNFTTRDTDEQCKEGCVGCYKDPTKMFYYGQTASNYSLLTSQDNACIALNPWNYDWDWSVSPGNSTTTNNYVNITKADQCSTSTANSKICQNHKEGSDDMVDPLQTSTALGDNTTPRVSTTINTFIAGRPDVVGFCRVENNFRDVVVQEDKDCHSGTTQSPTPYNGTTNACTNALISARFSRPIVDRTLTLDTAPNGSTNGNVIIEECDNEPSATTTSGPGQNQCHKFNFAAAGVTSTLHVFDYSHAPTQENLLTGNYTENTNPEGFIIDVAKYKKYDTKTIINKGYLKPNKWYRIVLLGGETGIRGSKIDASTTIDTNIPEGHLITPSYGTSMWNYNPGNVPQQLSENSDMPHDYYWKFKTGSGICDIDTINVQPYYKFMKFIGMAQKYDAMPQAANCNILARCFMDWDWQSLLATTTANIFSPTHNTAGDAAFRASVTNSKSREVCGLDDEGFVDPVQTSTAISTGKAFITAIEEKGRNGYGQLQIGDNKFEVSDYFPTSTKCVNTPIRVTFNIPAKADSVRIGNFNHPNIKLLRLGPSTQVCHVENGVTVCEVSPTTIPVDLYEDNPKGLGSSTTTSYSIQVRANNATSSQLLPGETYRVEISGSVPGVPGILSFDGQTINNLNYISQAFLHATDTYAWTFTVSPDAKTCGPEIILNPCPNGVWRILADQNVNSLRILVDRIFPGTSAPTTGVSNCQQTMDGIASGNSFFAKVWYKIKTFVQRLVGVAVASNYWCTISDQAYGPNNLKAMDRGNYTRKFNLNSTSSVAVADAIAYSDGSAGKRVINYLNNGSWQTGDYYRVRLEYSEGPDYGTSTATSTTTIYHDSNDINKYCSIANVKAEIWPLGERRSTDNFFCTGDYCGSNTSAEKYDDDQSASWNKDFDFGTDKNIPANQHLYRFWAYGTSSKNFMLKSTFADSDFSFVHFAAANGTSFNMTDKAFFPTSIYPSSTYNGARWVTAGNIQGYDLFRAKATDNTSSATGTVQIGTFFCNNPWPDFAHFPFYDELNNCNVSSTGEGLYCPNTNFSTYYCRDRGRVSACIGGSKDNEDCKTQADCPGGTCDLYTIDDLPSIGNYNSSTNRLNIGITGLVKESCSNLPNNFTPSVGYYSSQNGENAVYLWDSSGNVFKSTSAGGWDFISRGDLTQKGLPANFKPVAGYYYSPSSSIHLWDASGVLYVYAGDRWSKNNTSLSKLPSGFKPSGGSYFNYKNQLMLWDGSGRYTELQSGSWKSPSNVNTIDGITSTKSLAAGIEVAWKNEDVLFNVDGNEYVRPHTAGAKWALVNAPHLTSVNYKPRVGYNIDNKNETLLWSGQTSYFLNSSSGGWALAVNNFSNQCVTKLKEFLFTPNSNTSNLNTYTGATALNIAGNMAQFIDGSKTVTKDNVSSIYSNTAGTNIYWIYYLSNGIQQGVGTVNANAPLPRFNVDVPTAGKYYLTIETSNSSDLSSVIPLSSTNANSFARCYVNSASGTPYFFHHINAYTNSNNTVAVGSVDALASSPSNHQINTFSSPLSLSAGRNVIALAWTNDCYLSGSWDSNLVIYNLKLSRYYDEAIGIRVMSNDNHYPAQTWYNNWFAAKGAPSALTVDGYRGISDGRTVYVNAANTSTTDPLHPNTGIIYTNVYLMSRSQDGSAEMENIFNQMVHNWNFNYNLSDMNVLENVGTCFNSQIPCLTDSTCGSEDYCVSNKAKVTRDTQRVEDIQNMNSLLLSYYNIKRCNNDQTRTCIDDSNCYGGGKCSKYFPDLKSGSYIAGKSYSVWPSWQETLGKALGTGLAIDPVNKFYGCSGLYNETTCWDPSTKTMQKPSFDSAVYFYFAYNATGTRIYGKGEFNDGGANWRPLWSNVNGLRYNPFDPAWGGLITQMPVAPLSTCGNGHVDTSSTNPSATETCLNCPMDMPPGSCKVVPTACNHNNIKELGEECDTTAPGCTNCKLDDGYSCDPADPKCAHPYKCGDGVVNSSSEKCDGSNLNGKTCATEALGTSGTLTCKSDCTFNTSGCALPTWYCSAWSSSTDAFGKCVENRNCSTVSFAGVVTTLISGTRPIISRPCNCQSDYNMTCAGKCGSITDTKCGNTIACESCAGGKYCETSTPATLGGVCKDYKICTGANQHLDTVFDSVNFNKCICNSGYTRDTKNKCVTCPSADLPVSTLNSVSPTQYLDLATNATSCFSFLGPINLDIDLSQPGITPVSGTAVVFASDLSGSMLLNAAGNCLWKKNWVGQWHWCKPTVTNGDECGIVWQDCGDVVKITRRDLLKQALLAAIPRVFGDIDPVKIGLVSFHGSSVATIDSNLVSFSSQQALLNKVGSYDADGGTNTGGAIKMSKQVLDGADSTINNKIIILMSDGLAADQDYAEEQADVAKKAGIKIYSAAFGESKIADMNTLSSNVSSTNSSINIGCGSNYCYGGSDLGGIYDNIVDDIISRLLSLVSLNIKDYKNELLKTVDMSSGIGNYSLILNLSTSTCGQSKALTFEASGLTVKNGGVITIAPDPLKYCPGNSIVSAKKANGNVAGVFEEKKIGIYDKIINALINPFLIFSKLLKII